ncbi:MAG: Protein of unknown function precursor containing a C-terminal secretion signal [Bacteroidetes bacterium]|nr:Protein of unknown function precursor containing a C-terminal secretion signal [Bacteroidota bacterium]
MKKNLLYALALSSVIGINTSKAQLFIREYNLIPTDVYQDKPVDVSFEKNTDTYSSLHESQRGNMPVPRYDATTHATITGANLSKAGIVYDPQAIVQNDKISWVLFNDAVSTGIPVFAISRYDHTTNIPNPPLPNIYFDPNRRDPIVARDFVLSDDKRFLYVVGDITIRSTGRTCLYVAKIDATTLLPVTDHVYANDRYDLNSNNIFLYTRDEIYIGAGAVDPNDNNNRGAYVLEINSVLNPVASTIIYFKEQCGGYHLTKAVAKRYKERVYILCPSFEGDDINKRGDYFFGYTDPVLTPGSLVANTYYPKSFYFYNNVAPKFEFVNNFQNIMVSGISSPNVSDDPGYVHGFYDMNTAYQYGFYYPNTNVDNNGDPIVDAWNSGTNQVFSVAEDFGRAPLYYALNSKTDGYISDECNKDFKQDLECDVFNTEVEVPNDRYGARYTRIPEFKIDDLKQDYQTICGEEGERSLMTAAVDKNDNWNVYPNPASTSLEIAYGSNIQTIVITNIKGQQVKMFTNVNALHMIIDISELPKGMYFINAISADHTSINKKFIKE